MVRNLNCQMSHSLTHPLNHPFPHFLPPPFIHSFIHSFMKSIQVLTSGAFSNKRGACLYMRDSTLPTEDAAASPSTAAEQAHVQCDLEREGTWRVSDRRRRRMRAVRTYGGPVVPLCDVSSNQSSVVADYLRVEEEQHTQCGRGDSTTPAVTG